MSGINLGDSPSWLKALGIGIVLWYMLSNGMIDAVYQLGSINLPTENFASLLVVGGAILGAFHVLRDVGKKL